MKNAFEINPRRDRTAIRRVACSRPISWALADGVISRETFVFDYGCGYGSDLKHLRSQKIKAQGWDPHFFPKETGQLGLLRILPSV